jgi:hypothetical protein
MKFLLGSVLFEQRDAMQIYSGAFAAETQPSLLLAFLVVASG